MNTPFSRILSNQYIQGAISEAFWDSLLFSEAKRIVNAANSGFHQAAFNEALSFVRLYESALKRGKTRYFGNSTESIFSEYTGVANMIASTFSRVARGYFDDFRKAENDPAKWGAVFNYCADTWFRLGSSGTKDGVDFRGWVAWMPCMLPTDTSKKRNIVNYYLTNHQMYLERIKETFGYDLEGEWIASVLNESKMKKGTRSRKKVHENVGKKGGSSHLPLFENFNIKNPAMMAASDNLTKNIKTIITAFQEAYPDGVSASESSGWMLDQVFRKIIEELMDDAAVTGFASHIELVAAVAAFFKESTSRYGKVFMMGDEPPSFYNWLFANEADV